MSRDALVVGINSYERLRGLTSPAEDAEAIAQLLTDYGDFKVRRLPAVKKDGSIRVGQKTKVTLTQLEEALVQLFKPTGENIPETALLFFSGHGLRKDRGIQEGFLGASDVNPDLGLYGLSLQWLRRLLQDSPIRQQIIWLDCCYSGELLNFAEADPGDRGKGRARCFIAASREFEVAYEAISGTYSVMTEALLRALDPKQQPEGLITNYTLIDFLNQALKSATQRPLYANSGGQIILTGRGSQTSLPVLAGVCPYKGLAYFDCNQEDPKYFHGRTPLTDQLLEKVRCGNFLAVLGASGSGKSSVVRAGLLHQLKLGVRLSGSDEWPIYIFRPGEHPLQRLAEAFVEPGLSDVDRATQLAKAQDLIAVGAVGLGHLITAQAAFGKGISPLRVVLVVDQFEEAFTLCQNSTQRQQFFDCLLGAVEKQNSQLCLVLTMRADFFSKCVEYAELAAQIQEHLVTVTPMTQEELEQAITEPAKQVGLDVEQELVTQMITDVEDSPGSLPILQYTLTELWQQRTVDRLTLSAYTRLGGVKGTLQKRANEVYESLSSEEQQTAKRIFLELTQLGEGTEDTRRQIFKRDLVSNEQSEALVDQVIQKLADAKLVVTSTLVEKGLASEPVAVVDVAHEALIRFWPLLRQWLNENRDALKQKRIIEANAQEWLDKGKATDYRLQGLKLAEAEDFVGRYSDNVSLSSLAQEYLQVSQQERDRQRLAEEERRKRELEQEKKARKAAQMLNRVAGISVVGLTGLAIFAGIQLHSAQKSATTEKRESITARTQASEALFLADKQLDSLIEAVQAGRLIKDTNQKPTAVLNPTTIALQQAVYGVRERNRLVAHNDQVWDVSFSPDGKTIASASRDGTVKLWNVNGQEIKALQGHKNAVATVSFSPDGKTIASAGWDTTIKLWNLEGQELKTLKGHYSDIYGISFSPDGKTIASASRDGTIKLWNLEGQELKTLRHGDIVIGVSFSSDGKTITSASRGGKVKFWNLEGQELKTFELKTNKQRRNSLFNSVKFSPNGKTIASADRNGTIQLWNMDGEEIEILQEHSQQIKSTKYHLDVRLSFSPDSTIIASAGKDGNIKLWKVAGRDSYKGQIFQIKGHSNNIFSVSFSPDSKTIATASDDGNIKLWSVEGQPHQQTQGYRPNRLSFSPDNKTIAFTSASKSINLWNLEQGEPNRLAYPESRINDLSFSPDGKTIATASSTVLLWNLENRGVYQIHKGHPSNVTSVSFSPDGKMIASGSEDGTGALWNFESQTLKTLIGHGSKINSISFSPAGKTVASASDDGTVKLWNLEGKQLKNLQGHRDKVSSVSFSTDGKTVASASYDCTIKLWNLENEDSKTIRGHNAPIVNVSFSPDGQTLVSFSMDNIVKLWNLEGQELKTLQDGNSTISDISFSADGQSLAAASSNLILWNFNLDKLLIQGCDLLRDYLKNPNNGMQKNDSKRRICDDIRSSR